MRPPWLRYTQFTIAGLGLLAFSVAAMVLALLRLVEIGTCASHPVLVSVRPCPAGSAWLIGLFPLLPVTGLIGWALYLRRTDRRRPSAFDEGPDWSSWWWPGVFVGGSAAFVTAARTFGASGETAGAVAMGACAALFVAMGLAPLAFTWRAQVANAFGGRRPAGWGSLTERVASLAGGAAPPGGDARTGQPSARDAVAEALGVAPHRAPPEAGGSALDADDELVDALERLAALHRAGDLSDGEFSSAKAQVLRRARTARAMDEGR